MVLYDRRDSRQGLLTPETDVDRIVENSRRLPYELRRSLLIALAVLGVLGLGLVAGGSATAAWNLVPLVVLPLLMVLAIAQWMIHRQR